MSRFVWFPLPERRRATAGWLAILGILFLAPIILTPARAANNPGNSASAAADPPPAGPAANGASSGELLLLDVEVNGRPIGKIGEFTLRGNKLFARPSELHDLGFRLPQSRSAGNGLISLSNLAGVTWRLDQANQALHITASDASLLPTILRPAGSEEGDAHRAIESGTGTTLNYDVVSTFGAGQTGASGSLDMRAFSPWGVASSGWLAYAGSIASGPGSNTAIRLDSTYMFSNVNRLQRYTAGDFITTGLSWTRPVHLGGVQVRSDFSMRPDLITFPLPALSGSTAVPSTVNLLADGNLVASGQVESGPFQVPQLPVVSGAGTISMTMTNALGQQVTVTQPFYASSDMLAPGLQTFGAEAGLVRRNWGVESNNYGKMAASAIYRRGLTPKFTMEGAGQATPGAAMAGAGGLLQIGNVGVVNFAAAASGGSGSLGGQYSAGAERIGRRFSLGGSAIVASRRFLDIAAMNGDGVTRKQLSGFMSLYLRRLGSAGVAYSGVDQDAPVKPLPLEVLPPQHSDVISANYSLQIHRVSIYVSEFKSNSGGSGSTGFQIGLTVPFGRRGAVNLSATSEGNVQVVAQRAAPQVGDWGYQAYAELGNENHVFGQMQYKSPVGLFTAGVDDSSGQATLRVESQGAFSLVDRGLFPSNEIYDSFAIVDTSPLKGVHVMQENRDVGTTNSAGRLLVPDMRSFDLNHVSLKAADIPADATLNDLSQEFRPQDRSGVVVKFPIQFTHGVLLSLVDENGVPLPLGSTATLAATGTAVAVGYDGEAYLEGLSAHNVVTVKRNDGRRCTVSFNYQPIPGDIPKIGPLHCTEQKP